MNPYYNRETKTLYLKRDVKNPYIKVDGEINIYLTAVSKETYEEVKDFKKLPKEIQEELQLKHQHIDLTNMVMFGNGNKDRLPLPKLKEFLYVLVSRSKEYSTSPLAVKECFRNYENRYESWLHMLAYVNTCQDIKMCWESALRKLGAKGVHGLKNDKIPFYVVIWYDQTPLSSVSAKHNLK